jgi:WD40 repeat protein
MCALVAFSLLSLAALSNPRYLQAQDLHSPVPSGRVLITPSGTVVAAQGRDQKLRIWRLPAQEPAVTIETHASELMSPVLSNDGLFIAAGDRAGNYSVWDTRTGKLQWQYKAPYYASAIAFDAAGKRLALAPVNEPVRIFDVQSGKNILTLQPVPGSADLAFSPDGTRLATADSDTAVRIYDSATGKLVATYTGFLMEPLAIAFTPDGRHVVSGGGDQFIAMIDSATGKLDSKSAHLSDAVAGFQLSPDGKSMIVILIHAPDMSVQLPLKVFDTAALNELREWKPPANTLGGQWTSDAHVVVANGAGNDIHISRAW